MRWAFRKRKSSGTVVGRSGGYSRAMIGLEAFLDGFTGAGLFGPLRRPGAPTEFMDSRTVEEYLESSEFEETLKQFGYQGQRSGPKGRRSSMIVEPGDDARAAERVVALLEKYAVRFDPVDRITFYSELVRRLVTLRAKLEAQMRADD